MTLSPDNVCRLHLIEGTARKRPLSRIYTRTQQATTRKRRTKTVPFSTEIILRLRTNGLSVFAHQGVDLTISGNTGSHCGSPHRRLSGCLICWAPFFYIFSLLLLLLLCILPADAKHFLSLQQTNKQTNMPATSSSSSFIVISPLFRTFSIGKVMWWSCG